MCHINKIILSIREIRTTFLVYTMEIHSTTEINHPSDIKLFFLENGAKTRF